MKSAMGVNLGLLLVAIIWGFGFVPQRLGMDFLGPAAFNAQRFALGALTLIPVLLWRYGARVFLRLTTMILGLLLGVLLFAGALLQQIAIQYTTLANVAFITGLYVIIVPLLGLFLGYRYRLVVWSGGLVAITGLYLMSGGSTDIALRGDLLALAGAVFWAIHLLALAVKAGDHNPLVLAFYQFLFCAILSLATAFAIEDKVLPEQIQGYFWPIVNGVFVVGVGYTLQVMLMDKADPFAASLIFSLEAVFGALAGYWVFAEKLAVAGLMGAGLMLLGCILAQIPETPNAKAQGD